MESLFIRFCLNNNFLNTCFAPYLCSFDKCILRTCCKDLNRLLLKNNDNKKKIEMAIKAIEMGYYKLISLWPNFYIDVSKINITIIPFTEEDENCQMKLIEENISYLMTLNMTFTIIPFYEMVTKAGNLKLLKWAFDNNYSGNIMDRSLCANVALIGNLEMLEYLVKNNYFWDSDVCSNAAKGNHLELLKWARSKNCLWSAMTVLWASSCGHLEILKYAIQNGCELKMVYTIYNEASYSGHIHILKWAKENSIDGFFDIQNCSLAARGGCLETLKWLKENKCPWDVLTCCNAFNFNRLEVLKWAIENGCPYESDDTMLGQRYQEMCDWIEKNGIKSKNCII